MNSKRLYITDLDGTLLTSDAKVSPFTASALCELTSWGVHISAATARTAATVSSLLGGSLTDTPVVLQNGVSIYDVERRHYVRTCYIEPEAKKAAIELIESSGIEGFWYAVEDDRLMTFYASAASPVAQRFMETRQKTYGKVFTHIDSFREIENRGLIYYSVSAGSELLAPVAEKIKKITGLRFEYYRDTYEENCFFLEICPEEASKKTAVDFLRKSCGFDEIVGFGDNYNDIPLLEACDRFYAVDNAVDALKERAAGVIGSNDSDGVARWLLENALKD